MRTASLFFTICLLAALCGFLFFYRLADRDLWGSHEARAAQDAQTVLEGRARGLPRLFDDKLELQKPPLYYWIVAGLGWLQGGHVDAWSVRLPAALAALACVAVVVAIAAPQWHLGLCAAVILTTMLHFTWLARTGRIDMPLAAAVAAALFCFYRAFSNPERSGRWYVGSYVAIAIAVLLKGPIGFVLPTVAAAAVVLVESALRCSAAGHCDWREIRTLVARPARSLLWGIPLVLLIAAPWFWWGSVHTDGALFRSFFLYHNVERAFGGTGGLRAHPWWFYGPRILVDALPWSLFGPPAIVCFVRHGRWKEDSLARFGLIWFASITLLLSLVRFKRADYLLPAYPGVALFLGCSIHRWVQEQWMPRRLAMGAVAAIVACCIGGWGYYVASVLPREEPVREMKTFAAEIRRHAPAPELVIFFRVEAHALAFHVGRPINTILEWENINTWAGRPGSHYIVMPTDLAEEWAPHVAAGELERVVSIEECTPGCRHEHSLVLLRTRPKTPDSNRVQRRPEFIPVGRNELRSTFRPK